MWLAASADPTPTAAAPPPPPQDIGTTGKSNTVFMPHSPGTLGDVSAQIRSGFMQAAAAEAGTMRR